MTEPDSGPPDPWVTRVVRDVPPPVTSRHDVVRALRANGLLRAAPGPGSYWWQAAAAVLLVAAGWMAGAATSRGGLSDASPRFVFFVYGEPGGSPEARAAEYGAWARAARERGTPVSGERLLDGRRVIGAPPQGDPGGFFIVHAATAEAAAAIAAEHPHVRDGGTIVIRQVAGGSASRSH